MTAEHEPPHDRVKRIFPLAVATYDTQHRDWAVWSMPPVATHQASVIGYGTTELDAWLDAAARMI